MSAIHSVYAKYLFCAVRNSRPTCASPQTFYPTSSVTFQVSCTCSEVPLSSFYQLHPKTPPLRAETDQVEIAMASDSVVDIDIHGSLPKVASGKVRDLFVVDEQTLLFVASDRISAYDVVMKNV